MNLIVAITGASGVIYGVRMLEALKKIDNVNTYLIMSNWAIKNIEIETDYTFEYVKSLADKYLENDNLGECVASGSFKTNGMIILPCSMKTMSSISNGYSDGLIGRAADVVIKEGRKLIICPRETPLSTIHLENMLKLSRIGVKIMPPMPAFYSKPKSIDNIINHHIMKVLSMFDIEVFEELRWQGLQNNIKG